MSHFLVVIPTYNERENLPILIPQVLLQGCEYQVLIVDDNSPDGTGQIADHFALEYPGRVQVLHRTGKLGLATAYLEGFVYGINHGYDYIFEMDADFSHKPEYLPRLLEAARLSGVAVGSRNIAGGDVEHWPWYRKLISRGGSLYSRLMLGIQVRDCTSGFKCFSRPVLEKLNLPEQVTSTGFGFQVEVNCLCEWQGYQIKEVPIVFPDRIYGKSKMSRRIFFEAYQTVWQLRLRKGKLKKSFASDTLRPFTANPVTAAADSSIDIKVSN